MRNRMMVLALLLTACCVAGSDGAESGVELATYQVPDLAAPQAPSADDLNSDPIESGEAIPAPSNPFVDNPVVDDGAIPMPSVYHGTPHTGTTVSLFDSPPVPYPGTELWAGRYGNEETLQLPECPPAWASVDLLWLQRDGADDRLLASDGNLATLRNDNFEFDYEAGVRIVYGEVVNCIPIEFTYFGTHDWSSTIALDGNNNLTVPGAQLGSSFNNADRIAARYASELHSLELNVLKFDGCHLSWLGGVRYIDAEDDFALRADNDGLLTIGADNRLLGMQLGTALNYGCDNWCLGLTTKAGAYVNFAERETPVNNRRAETHDDEFAFVGEVQLGVTRQIGCGLKLRAGYELLWIDGLALAAEQVGAPGAALPAFNTNGDTLYDGGYIGLEWQR